MTQSERPWSPGHTNKENQDFYLTECRKWATQANWFRWTKYLNNPNKRNGNFPWKNFRKQACSSGQQQKANFFLKYQIKWTLDLYLCACKSKSTPDDQNNTNKRLLQPDRYQRERESIKTITLQWRSCCLFLWSPKVKETLKESEANERT